jgi:hypothetical protein
MLLNLDQLPTKSNLDVLLRRLLLQLFGYGLASYNTQLCTRSGWLLINVTDRAVLANAYVSGMRESVHLVGNEYNILVTCLSVGCKSPMPKHRQTISEQHLM